ncbi:hypothetical protein PASE110613_14350 [Paenibacillus sediminis]|uniref:Uncharacterized protein n=1 Tax=Paenibacillus sediminis TaxID=664909 RepID=A0ABS4H7P0_9BACL|nr:hypothetical protein [Paenibacillus sediminis]MBP1938533.1 hypothetical protein [Paenibacillus sediminis]
MSGRFIGYAINGQPFENPYFPADYPSETVNDWKPETLDWIVEPWTKKLVTQGPFDDAGSFDEKVQWFAKYFFKQNPNLRRTNDLYNDSVYWAKRLTLHNNPDESTGSAT